MPKPNATEASAPALVSIRAIHTIVDGSGDGRKEHVPGSILEVPAEDAEKLIQAGAAMLPTDDLNVPIEELLPPGIDPRVWRADPRLRVNGQKPSSFVQIADFEEQYPRNR
jgi:hypothetical protein